MFRLALTDRWYLGIFLQGYLYGLYSGIFGLYLQYQGSKQDINKAQKILFYSTCVLYVTCAFLYACDIASCICFQTQLFDTNLPNFGSHVLIMQTTLFACSDFIAQFILIYRCWIIWGRNIRVVIIPSILAFAFLGIWIGGSMSTSDGYYAANEGLHYSMPLIGLTLSLTVNALVTGLIIFRILQVFREVKATNDRILSAGTGGSKLRRVILVLIESAVALFSIQLARLVVNIFRTDGQERAFNIITVIHQMLNGITPTIILVRTSMELSFHDEKSMEELAIGSLRFTSNHQPSPIVDQEAMTREDANNNNTIDVQRRTCNGIDTVER